jgi:hypothetical protein
MKKRKIAPEENMRLLIVGHLKRLFSKELFF